MGEWNIYKDGQLAAQNENLSISHVVKPGGVAVLGQDQDIVGGGFDLRDAFTGELAQVNLWDVVLSAAEIAAQFKHSYIPHGSVIQWSQFKLVGEVEIRKYIGEYTWFCEGISHAAASRTRAIPGGREGGREGEKREGHTASSTNTK